MSIKKKLWIAHHSPLNLVVQSYKNTRIALNVKRGFKIDLTVEIWKCKIER